ncbi:DNA ligase D [Roseicyclus sp. F158]|uniref:DNA ligase (ATP) n=1 Tax=Tropicimonas omnivorans TaxID=3075590 RepID=A0ABU3DGM0_9RHOB|nr:DNA ligase D [Roseicyclus sp. F158]MDT0682868.1 DNA ligase D [Roseicyclus sp. F158]
MTGDADRLKRYNEKRDFARTSEPKGEAGRSGARLKFYVQKHAATRLHWDFRLEWDGALLSWAVTKGPSDDPGEKRLAVRTEDHPLSYGTFEGTIPKKEYGGGTVMLWDRGDWEPLHDPAEGLESGKLHFRLGGERMEGGWALVRMRGKKGETRENWLLIKEKDDLAGDDGDRLTRDFTTSVKTSRGMDEIAEGRNAPNGPGTAAPKSAQRGKRPAFEGLQLATLVEEAPEGDDWWHETKFDGYRCLIALGKGGPVFYTRSGKDWSDRFADLEEAAAALPCKSALIDGEVMAARIDGSPFSSLQAALSEGGPLVFHAFDCLAKDGTDLRGKPLTERRAALEALLADEPKTGKIRLTEIITGDGGEVFAAACEEGAEGVISKRTNAPYRAARSKAWVKVKCTKRQEFVIGGLSPSDKAGRPFSSLLLGEFRDRALIYRGRVGTGFKARDFEAIGKAARPRKTSPFEDVPKGMARGAIWVTPDMIAEVDFTELTRDGHIRHGAFLGLRSDKDAAEVRMDHETAEENAVVAGIAITHPGRQLFSGTGITKLDFARYYEMAGERMVEAAGDRPLSLLRCPSGPEEACFFQKHPGKGWPEDMPRVEIEEKDGMEDYLYATRPSHFVASAQMGAIEFHIWGARRDRLDRPDRVVFDLDPDGGLDFADVKHAAFDVKDRLEDLGIAASAMVTGGKGVHVWAPLRRTRSWETVKLFSKTVAHVMQQDAPDRYVATMSKAKRKGKIFIDWLRNERGSTAITPYSVRARPGGPVARPVTWDELDTLGSANAFTLDAAESWWPKTCPYLAAQDALQSITDRTIEALEKMTS